MNGARSGRLAAIVFVAAAAFVACAEEPAPRSPARTAAAAAGASDLPVSTLRAEGMDAAPFVKLTKWIDETPMPIFSILVARHDKLVFELYTGGIDRDDAHYVMSVTKSVLSALVGIAIDRGLIASADAPIADLLPRAAFPSDDDAERFRHLTLRQAMGMQGIDAPDPPRVTTPEAKARYARFWSSPSRLAFVLHEPLLPAPDGRGFQYNDATPTLAAGVLRSAAKESVFDFGEEALFRPLGFRNEEWLHEDASGLDNGGYGLRLRPIDMTKLGLLYLHGGAWQGKPIVSRAWVTRSLSPWNTSPGAHAGPGRPDYGWYWWAYDFGPGFAAHVANGWKGQRIAVFPEQDLVVTMTGCVDDGSENALFDELVKKIVIPSLANGPGAGDDELPALLAHVQAGAPRLSDWIEYRMVPSKTPKSRRR